MNKLLKPDKAILSRALDSWRQWGIKLRTRPSVTKTLAGGLSNHSFLLDSDGTKMVLRVNGTDAVLPGASRKNETTIWKAVSASGIAPPLLHVDETNGLLVSAYINNQLPGQPPLNKACVDQALGLLKRCHRLDLDVPRINYAGHAEHYWRIIESNKNAVNTELKVQRKPMQRLLEKLLSHGGQTGLCHNDPVIANFVGSPERLYLIDWEYASQGLLVMDYAALAVEWNIDDTMVVNQTGMQPELLSMAKTIYRYFCALWQQATTHQN